MITSLNVEWFKSIREVNIDCRRVNVFIGEPNAGKSNILEALGVVSWCGLGQKQPLSPFVRMGNMMDLFFDGLVQDAPIHIQIQHSDGSVNRIEISIDKDSPYFFIMMWTEKQKFALV